MGEVYAGEGNFMCPLPEGVEGTIAGEEGKNLSRVFLSPLVGLVVHLQFHPGGETVVCKSRTRRYPVIIGYRVDGVFATSFSATFKVCEHAFPVFLARACVVCSSHVFLARN